MAKGHWDVDARHMPTVGWIGVGNMGAPLAGTLVDAGYRVRVWNRTGAKADPLKARGAEVAGIDPGVKYARSRLHHGRALRLTWSTFFWTQKMGY